LALVSPDGTTVIHEYTPSYPLQFDDASYGLAQLGNTSSQTLMETAAPCTVLVPSNGTLGTTWTANGFDDSQWTDGTTGVGYERSSTYNNYINTDLETQMYNQQSSVYIRVPFSVTDVGEISGLELQLQYDDGFVAYLNGVEVARDRAPGGVTWSSGATSTHDDSQAVQFVPFSLSASVNQLVEGTNVLAIHGLNSGSGSSDLLFQPRLVATRLSDPSLGDPGYFLVPTPGAVNGTDQGLPASNVTISEPSRTFTGSFQVALSGAGNGQTIRYTLDGSTPTSGSAEYGSAITISSSAQLRARIIGANGAGGPIAMASYLRLGADLQGFSSNLPILVLENWGGGDPGGNSQTDTFWAIIEPDAATNNRAEMLDPLTLGTRAGVKRRGSSSFNWPKYSMTLEAQDEDGLDLGVKPLGMPKEADWVLSGRYQFDRALMRNDLIYRLSNEAGEYAVRTRFVEVFNNTGGGDLSYSGDYFGVYTLMEKIKRDDNRVDVAKISPGDTAEPDISGGYMFKMDRGDPGDGGFSVNNMGTLRWVEPKEEEVEQVPAQVSWLRNNLNELDAALYASDWTHPSTGKHFTEYLDQYSWLRHHWCNTLAMNVDGFRLSGYYYKHRDDTNGGRVGAGPIWDFDRTMGSTDSRDNNPQAWDGTGDSSKTWSDSRFPWWGRALTNPDFRQAHTDLWQELRRNVFSTANIHAIIDEFAAEIDHQDGAGLNPGLSNSPAERNFDKWPGSNHPNEVSTLKNWLQTRSAWIDSQYTSPPSFTVAPGQVSPGTSVSFSGGGGTTYYTIDGSDPRAPGGNVSASASTSPPINITETTIVTARSRSGTGLTSWSGPISGTYLVGPIANASNLVISELHYAPAPPDLNEQATSTDPSAFEWIEFLNLSPTDTIDLTDVHFEAGIEFSFTGSAITSLAPGARVLVVSDQAAFEARYGTGMSSRIAGEFAPSKLDNAGERIHLVDALGATIQDFTYNDKSPWPAEAGFPGYSLVLITGGTSMPDLTLAENWRSSSELGGNPDTSDSTPLVGDPVADSDGDDLKLLLEHALGTSDDNGDQGPDAFGASVEAIEVDDITSDYLVVTFQRQLGADDVDIDIELSSDGTNWSGGPGMVEFVSQSNHGDGTSTVRYRSTSPFLPGLAPRGFARIVARQR
ncbi:MAG: CotH kinase family protein, partial [Verrucomicrobiales bacterium]